MAATAAEQAAPLGRSFASWREEFDRRGFLIFERVLPQDCVARAARRDPPRPGPRPHRRLQNLPRHPFGCVSAGLKSIPHERRRPRDVAARVAVLTAAAEAGRKDHDRWPMKRNLLARKLAGRRATSKLPALLDFVLTRPIVSAGMIAAEIKITPRACPCRKTNPAGT